MEGITLGQIALWVAFLVGLITGLRYLASFISSSATKWLQGALEPTNTKLDELDKKIIQVDKKVDESELSDCKNYLVSFLADIKKGNEITEVEQERFHETYERYTAMGGNSYIHTEVEKLKKEGKL